MTTSTTTDNNDSEADRPPLTADVGGLATVKLTLPVEAPLGLGEGPSDGYKVPTAPQLYYETHHHVTYREYHVVPSTATPGRYWVMNVLDLIMCVHDDAATAEACAGGTYCNRGGPGSGNPHHPHHLR